MIAHTQIESSSVQTYLLQLQSQTVRERLDHLVNEMRAVSFLNEEEGRDLTLAAREMEGNIEEAMSGILCLVVERAFGRVAENGDDETLDVLEEWQNRLNLLLEEQLGSKKASYLFMYREAIEGVASLKRNVVDQVARGNRRITALYDEANQLMMQNYETCVHTREELQELQRERQREISHLTAGLQEVQTRSLQIEKEMVETARKATLTSEKGDKIRKDARGEYMNLQKTLGKFHV